MNVMTSVAADSSLSRGPEAVAPGPARFTAAEFERMMATGAFEDMWLELVGGELQRMPPPGNMHSRFQMMLVARLLPHFPEALLRADMAIRLGDDTVVGCDAAILNRAFEDDGPVPAAVLALVAEVAVSTIDRDLALKRRLYAAAGIPAYWVVDAAREVVHVFDRPADGDYAGLALVRFGEALAVPGTDAAITVG